MNTKTPSSLLAGAPGSARPASEPKANGTSCGRARRRALLVCPSARPGLSLLTETMPLCNVPILGQSLLEYWLSDLARAGIQDVVVLAPDRAEAVRRAVGGGARWGLAVEVQEAPCALSAGDAVEKYAEKPRGQEPALENGVLRESQGSSLPICVAELDHLPSLPEHRLFDNYREWYAAARAWLPYAWGTDRIGLREVRPGVWLHVQSHVLTRDLRAPCWIGKHVFVGEGAVIGPGAIVEEGVFVEPGAVVAHSYVGPHTYVGCDAELVQTVAWGNGVVDWSTGTMTRVADAFILSSLSRPQPRARIAELFDRFTGFYSTREQERSRAIAGEIGQERK